jgi:hypothetical protein
VFCINRLRQYFYLLRTQVANRVRVQLLGRIQAREETVDTELAAELRRRHLRAFLANIQLQAERKRVLESKKWFGRTVRCRTDENGPKVLLSANQKFRHHKSNTIHLVLHDDYTRYSTSSRLGR